MSGRLEAKRTLVTGAANGIGKATARLFAAEGARLVLTDIDRGGVESLATELNTGKSEVLALSGDISQETHAREMVAACVECFGGIDILVANAGVFSPLSILETETDEWDRVMAVDARGMFLSCKYAIAEMSEASSGSIVCLSSISGVAGQPRQASYGPAKFVASGLTMHLAVEWAERGIRVNAVAPGTIATEAVLGLDASYVEPLREAHPMRRLGETREVAEAILFLASDLASFITGVVLPVDGGYLAQ